MDVVIVHLEMKLTLLRVKTYSLDLSEGIANTSAQFKLISYSLYFEELIVPTSNLVSEVM